jgi:uncharacterized protein DUF6328
MKLDKKIKTALDETRLLILGSQVLFGFMFQSVFQEGFKDLGQASQYLLCACLALMVLSIAFLIAPSMQDRIVEQGQSTRRLEGATSRLAEWSLLPFLVSLGLALFVVFDRIFDSTAGIAIGAIGAVLAGFFWYGLAWLMGDRRDKAMKLETGATPLSTKIEQMLTEARVILPGCQALLGFQFIAMLTHGFDELPFDARIAHATALCFVTLATILLMTPAALHRESFGGEDSEPFLRLGSRFVMMATLPLALGIAADVYVVFLKITHSFAIALAASVALLFATFVLWYFYPMWLRAHRPR